MNTRIRLASETMKHSSRVVATVVSLHILGAGCAGSTQEVRPEPAVQAPVQVREISPEEHQYAGVAALKSGDRAKAKSEFEKAVSGDPKLVIANYDLGFIAHSDGDLETAARYYQAVLAENPDHNASILNLGKIYRDQHKYEEGARLFEKALETSPFDVNYLNNLAVFYRLAKDFDKATATVRRLLSRTRDNPDAYKNLALIAFDQEQLLLAEFIGGNAKKLDEKDPGVLNNLGLVYMKLGERRLALKQFKRAVALDGDFAPGHANIGAMALSYRDYENAAASFEKVVRLEPTNANAHLNLAWSYEGVRLKDGTHRTADAVAEFEKVLSLVRDQPDALYGMARAYAGELKDLPRAKGYYERYVALVDGELRAKASQELQVLDQRIQAGAQAERMRREAEEKRKREEEEKRRKASEQQASDGSILDRVAEEAAQQAATEDGGGGTTGGAQGPVADPSAGGATEQAQPQPTSQPDGIAPAVE